MALLVLVGLLVVLLLLVVVVLLVVQSRSRLQAQPRPILSRGNHELSESNKAVDPISSI